MPISCFTRILDTVYGNHYEADTRSGKIFDIVLLIFIAFSLFLVAIESVNWIEKNITNN